MTLKKPPLVEAWMSFRFEPAVGSLSWTRERYRTFLDAVAETHPNVEEMTRRGIHIAASNRGGRPRIKDVVEQILAVRALTEDGLRALQLTPDELVVNSLCGGEEKSPGFGTLLEQTMTYCRIYGRCYQPIGILEAALHYVNLVDIPVPAGGILRSEEYLTLDFHVPPDGFGTLAAFEIKAIVQVPGSSDIVQLVFATMPSQTNDTHKRFRLEWHTPVRSDRTMTEDEARVNLQAAHARLKSSFCQAFTSKGWALFEPEEP